MVRPHGPEGRSERTLTRPYVAGARVAPAPGAVRRPIRGSRRAHPIPGHFTFRPILMVEGLGIRRKAGRASWRVAVDEETASGASRP